MESIHTIFRVCFSLKRTVGWGLRVCIQERTIFCFTCDILHVNTSEASIGKCECLYNFGARYTHVCYLLCV